MAIRRCTGRTSAGCYWSLWNDDNVLVAAVPALFIRMLYEWTVNGNAHTRIHIHMDTWNMTAAHCSNERKKLLRLWVGMTWMCYCFCANPIYQCGGRYMRCRWAYQWRCFHTCGRDKLEWLWLVACDVDHEKIVIICTAHCPELPQTSGWYTQHSCTDSNSYLRTQIPTRSHTNEDNLMWWAGK